MRGLVISKHKNRLRFDGELARLKNEIEELKSRITELEKIY